MNNETIFQQILEGLFVAATPITFAIFVCFRVRKTGIENNNKADAAKRRDPDFERQELKKYMSGFDYD